MKSVPRILPLVAVAIGGVLAVKLVTSAGDLPHAFSSAQAFAEGVSKSAKGAADAAAGATPAAVAAKPAPVCAPNAAELAKEAGLSPAELQVIQSLSARRGQLDQRETGMDTQLALVNAAQLKLDAKIAQLESLKGDINGLLGQMDAKQQAEQDRLVKVYEAMKPKDAAARFTLLDDTVRLPIAAKMKERALSAILAQMAPIDAKKVTEALAQRFAQAAATVAAGRQAVAAPAQTAAAAPPPAAVAPPAVAPAQTAQAEPEKPAAKPAKPRPAKPRRLAAAKPVAKPPATTAAAAPKAQTTAQAAPASPAALPPAAKPTPAPLVAKPAAKPAAAAPAATPPAAAAAKPG